MHTHPSTKSIREIENKRYHQFFNLAIFLAALTGVEIIAIFLPFARPILLTFLIACSVVKFFGVILWFMHLIYDNLMLFWVFLAGLVIAFGTVYALSHLFEQSDLDIKNYHPGAAFSPASKSSFTVV